MPDQHHQFLAQRRGRNVRPELERGSLRGILAEAERGGRLDATNAALEDAASAPRLRVEGVFGVLRVEPAVDEQGEVGLAGLRSVLLGSTLDRGELVLVDSLGVVQQSPDEGALAVVDRAGRRQAQESDRPTAPGAPPGFVG